MEKKQLITIICILALGIAFRFIISYHNIEMQPGTFVFYTMAHQAVASKFNLPPSHTPAVNLFYGCSLNVRSGFPAHEVYCESPYLTYLMTAWVWISGGLITVWQSLALSQLLFFILGAIAIYLLIKKLGGSEKARVLGIFIYAILPMAIMINAVNSWSGEDFIPVLAAFALLFLLYALEPKQRQWLWLIPSVLLVIASYAMWTGGDYVIMLYGMAVLGIILLKLLKNVKKAIAITTIILTISFFLFATRFIPLNLAGLSSDTFVMLTQTYPTATFYNTLYGLFKVYPPPLSLFYLIFPLLGLVISFLPLIFVIYYIPRNKNLDGNALVILTMAAAFGILFSMFFAGKWEALLLIPLAVFAALIADTQFSKRFVPLIIASGLLFLPFLVLTTNPAPIYAPQYMMAMDWIANNTPKNATFLTFFPDGSAIEAVGNRTSYVDALINAVPSNAIYQAFPKFLFANAYNFSYIRKVRPTDLLIRTYWFGKNSQEPILEGEANLSHSPVINNTNLWLLEQGNRKVVGNNLSMNLIYSDNDSNYGTYIYSVNYNS